MMDKQIDQCPLIVSKEYDQCYFLVHRAYSHFFGDMKNDGNPFYDEKELNFTRILDYCFEYVHDNDTQIKLYDTFDELRNFNSNNIFVEKQLEHI